jgi:hypothetical protein
MWLLGKKTPEKTKNKMRTEGQFNKQKINFGLTFGVVKVISENTVGNRLYSFLISV